MSCHFEIIYIHINTILTDRALALRRNVRCTRGHTFDRWHSPRHDVWRPQTYQTVLPRVHIPSRALPKMRVLVPQPVRCGGALDGSAHRVPPAAPQLSPEDIFNSRLSAPVCVSRACRRCPWRHGMYIEFARITPTSLPVGTSSKLSYFATYSNTFKL